MSDTKAKTKARSALVMECFEMSPIEQEQQLARLEVVARHATTAVYNSNQYYRIPLKFIWLPMAKIQDGLGGKTKAIITLVAGLLGLFFLTMFFVPMQLRMEAKGQLLPTIRSTLYSPLPGQVREIPSGLKQGSLVTTETELFTMYDADLAKQMIHLDSEIASLKLKLTNAGNRSGQPGESDSGIALRQQEAETTLIFKLQEKEKLVKLTHGSLNNPGFFSILPPTAGVILDHDFREVLKGKQVRPNERLIRIGKIDPENPSLDQWEIELKIPQKHVGQVLKAFDYVNKQKKDPNVKDVLDVDFLLVSDPTKTFKGKLEKKKVAIQAIANRDDFNEPEPVVMAWVRITGSDIEPRYQIPLELLVTGVEVHSRVRCGTHAMGYSLFYGVWEFLYEKIVFFF